MAKPKRELVRTGIAGLDTVLMGGIPRTNVILVQGPTGSGKTILGVEFIYRGITEYDEPGIIVVFETSPDKLIRDASGFGWKLQELQEQKKLQIVFTSPEVLDQEMRSPDSLLLETALEMGAQRMFIDGIGLLRRPAANGGMAPVTPASYREMLQQLIEGLNRENLTAILSHETGHIPESQLSLESAGFLADTVIQSESTHQEPAHLSQHRDRQKPRSELCWRPPHPADQRWQGVGSVPPGSVAGRPTVAALVQG